MANHRHATQLYSRVLVADAGPFHVYILRAEVVLLY